MILKNQSHLTGLPQIGWKKPALCVGEVGSRNEGGAGRSPRERSSGKEEAGYICREGTFSFPEGLQRETQSHWRWGHSSRLPASLDPTLLPMCDYSYIFYILFM